MGSTRIFGTDGIRGRAGEGWLTVPAVASLGAALAEQLGPRGTEHGSHGTEHGSHGTEHGSHGTEHRSPAGARGQKPHALLGHDGRRSGPELEAALARGLVQGGFDVTSTGLITTPGLALLTRRHGFQLGAMLSASHNPAEDNGIKVFSAQGDKLSDEVELALEARLRARPMLEVSGPGPTHDSSLENDYLAYLVEHVGADLSLAGLEIVVDCANGGGSRVAPRVFGRLGARVHEFAAEPDGDNINLNCGATHLGPLQAAVRAHEAHLGIALDGDGDRCLLVDERGEVVDGDGIMALLARHARERGELTDPRIVATVMSNRGLHKALRGLDIGIVTVDVGDRRVVEALRRENLRLGGEQSGHVVFGADNFHIGDGIYTALRVLRALVATKKSMSELASVYRAFPQVLLNVPVARKLPWSELPRVVEARERIERELGEDGRVLLRYSGTESLARVMVEGQHHDQIRAQAQELVNLIVAEIGAKAAIS